MLARDGDPIRPRRHALRPAAGLGDRRRRRIRESGVGDRETAAGQRIGDFEILRRGESREDRRAVAPQVAVADGEDRLLAEPEAGPPSPPWSARVDAVRN